MEKSKKRIIGIALIVLISIFGISYAFFNYSKTGVNREIIAGDIWLEMKEDNGIYIRDAFPMTREEALKQTDNTTTFTISGANTTEDEIIYYEIKLNEAEQLEGKNTRISPNLLRFDLIEEKNGVITTVIENASYNVLNETKIWVGQVESNTTSTLIKYTLRMWLSEDILISNTDPNADYTTDEWQDLFASVKISVYGDLKRKYAIMETLYKTVEYNYEHLLTEPDINGTRYIKGSSDEVTNNYVWYSGKLWRIVALNGDGIVKLVTQNAMTSITWDVNGNNNYANSQMRRWLNNEFLPTIEEDLIATSEWDYTGYESFPTTKQTTTSSVKEKVGLLNIYEYMMTGGTESTSTSKTYLDNGYSWSTMTPYTGDTSASYSASYVWSVGFGGGSGWSGATVANGARPSVNLISDIRISGGTGEVGNPYTIEGDKATGETSELLSNRINGEYVKFNNTLYRIVGVETINGKKLTKITMADYNVNKNTIATEVQFGATGDSVGATFTPTAGIGLYLKNWYEGSEVSETSRAMVATAEEDGVVWYQGPDEGTGHDYTLSKTGTPISATIGLPYYGEMFSTQQGLGYEELIDIWLMTKNSVSLVWGVYDYGRAAWYFATDACGVRPSVYLKSNVRLGDTNGDESVGTGQINSPYELVLE